MLLTLVLVAALQPNIEIGASLTPPAQVAGPWEGLVAPGEVAGFSLEVMTNEDQKVRELRLDTYVRKAGQTTRTYWSSGTPGEFVMRTGELHFHQEHTASAPFDVTLDMTYDPSDLAWKGSFRNPFFTGPVTLRRPTFRYPQAPVGTWRTFSQVSIWPTRRVNDYGCLNIGVGDDNAFVLWAESYNVFVGTATLAKPLFEDVYGELYEDSHSERYVDQWSFVAGNSNSGGRITGALSSDGVSFGGESEHYGNGMTDPRHPRRAFAWTRMLDFTCRP